MSWPTAALGNLCQINIGRTPSRSVSAFWEGGDRPWLSISDMGRSKEIRTTKEGITQTAVDACNMRLVKPGTVLFSFKLSIGKVGIASVPLFTNEAIASLPILDPCVLCEEFLIHALDTVSQKLVGDRAAMGMTLNKTSLAEIRIPLPPLEEQRRIAVILDKAQGIKAKVSQRFGLLQALARSLFVRRFGLPSENPRELPVYKLVDICNPKQWPTISSKQLLRIGYPVFGANGLIGYFDQFNHPDPTVLVTCRGATCGTINISPPNCYVTGNSMAMDNPDPDLITTEYLAWVLRLRGMHDVISGSAQPQITRQSLEAVVIPVPPVQAQRDFANELRAVARIDNRSHLSEGSLSDVSKCLGEQLIGGRRA
jgi:type I restriction enzyme, S subunit